MPSAAPTRALAPPRLVVATLLAALVTATCGSGDDDDVDETARIRAGQVREVFMAAGFPEDAADVGALVARGLAATHRTTYRTVDGEDVATVVITASPPRRRIDVIRDELSRTTLVEPDRTLECFDDGSGWRCAEVDPPATAGPLDPDALTDGLLDLARAAEEFIVTTGQRSIAGHPARCLIATPLDPSGPDRPSGPDEATGAEELCVSEDGVLLFVRRGDQLLEASSHRASAPPDSFRPPDDG